MKTIIFTGGDIVDSILVQSALKASDMIIAVDSGADTIVRFGVIPHVVIGDMDSIDEKTKGLLYKKGVQFKISPSEKDETDTELGIDYAIEKGATEITIVGGIYGDRIDHILANIMYATVSEVPIIFLNGMQRSFVKKGPTSICLEGEKNDLLSLIPLSGDVTGLHSLGLQWGLDDSTLIFGKPRGVSNVFVTEKITVSWKSGWLFITQTLLHS